MNLRAALCGEGEVGSKGVRSYVLCPLIYRFSRMGRAKYGGERLGRGKPTTMSSSSARGLKPPPGISRREWLFPVLREG
jgi:hypothetical protein